MTAQEVMSLLIKILNFNLHETVTHTDIYDTEILF